MRLRANNMVPRAHVREVNGGWQAEFVWYSKAHGDCRWPKPRERSLGPVRVTESEAIADAEQMFWTCVRNPLRSAA